MYKRILGSKITEALKKYPIVTVTGPRQSGKTTLCRELFPNFRYISLEDPDVRSRLESDPKSLFTNLQDSLILDEIQRLPQLTSYLQTVVDDPKNKQKFILTGSHSFLLLEAVSQSLAGRTRVFELLPLSVQELNPYVDFQQDLNRWIFQGGYPRIYQAQLNPTDWLKDYFRLYVERDLRSIINLQQLDVFERFVRLASGRVGQLINFSQLGNEAGVTQPTAQAWLTALKTSYVCFTLPPHFQNFNKRIVKTPKLYFYDTGLLCYLLEIRHPHQIDHHPLRGAIFENFVIAEFLKQKLNHNLNLDLYFWRDQKGNEVDLVFNQGHSLFPVEIKMTQTFNPHLLDGVTYFNQLQKDTVKKGGLVYGGVENFTYKNNRVIHWSEDFIKEFSLPY